jgi:hypothetical protein
MRRLITKEDFEAQMAAWQSRPRQNEPIFKYGADESAIDSLGTVTAFLELAVKDAPEIEREETKREVRERIAEIRKQLDDIEAAA